MEQEATTTEDTLVSKNIVLDFYALLKKSICFFVSYSFFLK